VSQDLDYDASLMKNRFANESDDELRRVTGFIRKLYNERHDDMKDGITDCGHFGVSEPQLHWKATLGHELS
jgi:hypothetical protein